MSDPAVALETMQLCLDYRERLAASTRVFQLYVPPRPWHVPQPQRLTAHRSRDKPRARRT